MLREERLESQDVFGFLRPEQLDILSDSADVIEYRTGDTVYHHGEKADHIFVVLEGSVLLRLPGQSGVSVPIDLASPGVIFGACRCFDIDTYSTTAECTQDSRLMKIESATLRRLMDQDLLMGYVLQRRISQIYFERYLETMRKLQGIVMSLPLDAEQ